jgi:RNA polymerase sigma-70 factor (ECF subfamily)
MGNQDNEKAALAVSLTQRLIAISFTATELASLDVRLRNAHGLEAGNATIEEYIDHVAHCLREDAESTTAPLRSEDVLALHFDDIAWALASTRHVAAALQRFEAVLIEPVPKALVRLSLDTSAIDEIRQELRETLLFGVNLAPPKLLEYRGRGPLAAWVRVVTLRLGYARLRAGAFAEKRQLTDDEALLSLTSDLDGPEAALVRATMTEAVRDAFARAVRSLTTEERAVLRSHVIDALTIEQIGALYQVHRSTAARWVAHARQTLATALRRELATALSLDQAACESILGLVQSRMDLSIDRLLQEEPPTT